MALNIESIISDAIETCGLNIEEAITEQTCEFVCEITQKQTIKDLIEQSIRYTIWGKEEELTQKIKDSIDEYIEDAVEYYIS